MQVCSARAAFFVTVVGVLATDPARAAEPLTVTLRSGRTFTASVDARSDEHRLWLRFGEGSTVILRPIAWETVTSAWRNGEPIPPEQLRQAVEEMESAAAEPPEEDDSPEPAALWQAPHRAPEIVPLVTSVAIDAHLANWDADAEPDGIVAVIRPLDEWGRLAAVNGVAEIELLGAVRRDFNAAPHSGGVAVHSLERWTRPLHGAIPSPHGYLLKLPFRAAPPHPLADAYRGRVRVRLIVPGHGVFEDVREGVAIQR